MRIIKSFLLFFLLTLSFSAYSITRDDAAAQCESVRNGSSGYVCFDNSSNLRIELTIISQNRIVGFYYYTEILYCRDYDFYPLTFVDQGRGFCPQADTSSCTRFEDKKSYTIPPCTDANPPACTDVGYNPNGFDTGSGFCPNGGSSNVSGCLGLDGGYFSIPPCTLADCPDGSQVDTALNQTCALPSQCWDGSIVFLSNGGECPSPPFICPDGTKVAKQSNCPTPDEEMYLCQDGTSVAISELCVTKVDTLCSDGSTAPSGTDCPTPSPTGNPDTICQDGTKVQDAADCPPVFIFQPDVKDTATSTTNNTTVTTTTVNGVTTSTTQTSTQETTIELNLDGVNSRLDQIVGNTDKTQFFLDDINKKLIQKTVGNGKTIYQRSNKTVSGALAAFYSDIQTSNLFVEVTDVFTVTANTGSGGCPIFIIPPVMGMPAIVIDQFCSEAAMTAYSIINTVLFFVASLITIRLMLGS